MIEKEGVLSLVLITYTENTQIPLPISLKVK